MKTVKNLRRNFERFCYQNRDKGIPNLMLYITIGTAIVYFLSLVDESSTLYYALCFDRSLILQGQVWRLITYVFTYDAGNVLIMLISLLCYFTLGRAMENAWGTFRFNLFYFTGVVMMDVFCMIFGGFSADVYYLNMSLFLGYATLYPNAGFLFLYIIPVKAWIFALLNLAMVALDFVSSPFPYNFFSIISLANYFLFFGADVLNVLPQSWRINARRTAKKAKNTAAHSGHKTIPFDAGSYQASTAVPKPPYTHRCTVCGRTDISHPDLEFRYCSRCNGYYCYCQEHISNHSHIQ